MNNFLVLFCILIFHPSVIAQTVTETTTTISPILDTNTTETSIPSSTTTIPIIQNITLITNGTEISTTTNITESTIKTTNTTEAPTSNTFTPIFISNQTNITSNETLSNVTLTTPLVPMHKNESNETYNIITIDLYDNSTFNMSAQPETIDGACDPVCSNINKKVVLAIVLCIFGGLVALGIFAYIAFYRKRERQRFYNTKSTRTTRSTYSAIPAKDNLKPELIQIPEDIVVEKV